MMAEQTVQIQTTLHLPLRSWEAWVARCKAQGVEPIAAFNEAIGPVVDQLLLGITPGPQER